LHFLYHITLFITFFLYKNRKFKISLQFVSNRSFLTNIKEMRACRRQLKRKGKRHLLWVILKKIISYIYIYTSLIWQWRNSQGTCDKASLLRVFWKMKNCVSHGFACPVHCASNKSLSTQIFDMTFFFLFLSFFNHDVYWSIRMVKLTE